MVTLDEPPALQPADLGADRDMAADAEADDALLTTLATRMHCRRPMQVVEDAEVPPLSQPLTIGILAPDEAPRKGQAPGQGTVTYRCACGFTIDVPAMTGQTVAA
ncbi:hypothetical protein LVY72_02795 [Arthrobacter sp. I2-34]|uniref:Uncharacterized protein n=1 Tax=Arthrobacter hankyongi TaxID=2904801 RepID=A0ABS9L2N5_9MICC|nr:hypothetical protein [Arthrobacter hankyongi]MCG2620838.1 hypothetical protein [Arthrobacter hankyongi]